MIKERRHSPEEFLRRAREEEYLQRRGKLKIYLGAAPGVGKTYTMLEDARSKHAEGLDVVVGIAESHGREEIRKLLKDLEILPLQTVQYHNKTLNEFDLDAAIKRNPGLILIDEMAHKNVPGSQNEKRWQDIKEVLEHGIDIYTTLNVQHIESLNDIVSQIIGVPIRETVPDSVLELADTIEVVDLPPEDLLKRLHEGKVYFPQQAEIAAEYFFRKGNLIALRELALRVTAERVETEVLLYRHGHGIKRIWPTKEKLLVCVGPEPESRKVIRTARRLAASLQGEWIAVFVDSLKFKLSKKQRQNVVQNLRFAEQLGADMKVLNGVNVAKEVLTYAREINITKIIVGRRIRPRWKNWLFHTLADDIVRQSGEIDVYVITGNFEPN